MAPDLSRKLPHNEAFAEPGSTAERQIMTSNTLESPHATPTPDTRQSKTFFSTPNKILQLESQKSLSSNVPCFRVGVRTEPTGRACNTRANATTSASNPS